MPLPLFDFAEYWAAGHLNAQGLNPYDPNLVEQLQRQLGREEPGVLMWNPPWTLPLVMPFGLLDPHAAHLIWLALQFALLLFSADWLWRIYGGNPERRWAAWLAVFTFTPTFFALTAGQISPMLLFGAALFLYAVRANRPVLSGFATLFLAIKPHLVLLFWIALFLWSVRERRWAFLVSGAAVGIASTLLAVACNPAVLGQYWQTMGTNKLAVYRSPTLGMLLRLWLGEEHFTLQFVPPLFGVLWLVWHWSRHRHNWKWEEQLPLVILVSMLTAAYGAWPFDLVLLVVPMMRVAARSGRLVLAVILHAAVSAAALVLMLLNPGFLAFVWMTPTLLAGYHFTRPIPAISRQ